MGERSYTAGPWMAVADGYIVGDWVIHTEHPNPDLRAVIEVNNASGADARLIAAAPALLEALEDVLNHSGARGAYLALPYAEAVARAEAIISKAKGASE